jgi:hypothetical protein
MSFDPLRFGCSQGTHHAAEGPSRLDAYIYVYAAGAAGFGPAAKPKLFEQQLHLERNLAYVCPTDAGARIEINPQLVGVVEIGGAYRMRM